MSKKKYFRIHWLGNLADNIIQGDSISDAFNKSFSSGATRAIDYYEEIKEFPKEEKPIVVWDNDSEDFETPGSLFVAYARKALVNGEKTFAFGFGRNISYFSVEETPLEFRLTKVADSKES